MSYDPVSDGILIADANSAAIRRFHPIAGTLDTVAGGVFGNIDGDVDSARFSRVVDVSSDAFGRIYVADPGNCAIRLIEDDIVSTVVGGCGDRDSSGGVPGLVAQVLALDVVADGRVVFVDSFNTRVGVISVNENDATPIITTVIGRQFDEIDDPAADAAIRTPVEAHVLEGGAIVLFDVETSRIRALGGLPPAP